MCLFNDAVSLSSCIGSVADEWMNTEQRWKDTNSGTPNDTKKNVAESKFVHTNLTWIDLGSNGSLC